MHKPKHLIGLGAIAAFTAALAAAPAAQANHVTPVPVDGTATCPAGYSSITKFDPAYAYGKAGITQSRPDDYTLGWTSTVAVDAVIVKGGDKANLYLYGVDTHADTGLSAPIGKYGSPNRISWVEYCTNNVPNPQTPPPAGRTTTPVSTPGSGILPARVLSGRAQLRGPSGCIKQAFRARVIGRSIAAVSFFVDGKRVKRLTGERSVYAVKIRPKNYGFARHRVVARVRFTADSGTAARRLPLTFRRCARQTVQPRFTG